MDGLGWPNGGTTKAFKEGPALLVPLVLKAPSLDWPNSGQVLELASFGSWSRGSTFLSLISKSGDPLWVPNFIYFTLFGKERAFSNLVEIPSEFRVSQKVWTLPERFSWDGKAGHNSKETGYPVPGVPRAWVSHTVYVWGFQTPRGFGSPPKKGFSRPNLTTGRKPVGNFPPNQGENWEN